MISSLCCCRQAKTINARVLSGYDEVRNLFRRFAIAIFRPIDKQLIDAAYLIDNPPGITDVLKTNKETVIEFFFNQGFFSSLKQDIKDFPILVHM